MSGRRYLLDTNIILNFLQGNSELKFLAKPGTDILSSIVSLVEVQCIPFLSAQDMYLIMNFFELHQCVNITTEDKQLIKAAVSIRKKCKLKLPHAIIAATAIATSSTLISADPAFSKIFGLKFLLQKNILKS